MASPLAEKLFSTTNTFLEALCANVPSLCLLEFFSISQEVVIQHAPARCSHPHTSRLTGCNAVRSYFDILAANWVRVNMQTHGSPKVDGGKRSVSVDASITWMWRKSRRRWIEDFSCTITFDESFKIASFVVETNSADETCLMRAKDIDP